MKSIKETIIFGALIVSLCIVGTVYATYENRTRESVDTSTSITMETVDEVIRTEVLSAPTATPAPTSTPTTTISLSDKEIEKAISEDRNYQEKARKEYQELLNTGYVRWSEPEVITTPEPTSEPEPELIPAPTPAIVVASYNTKDEYYNDLLNSFSDWDYDTSQLEYYGSKYITGYDACEGCCGKPIDDPNYGVTASLSHVKMGRTCAVNGLSFGTVLYIEGLGLRVVEDRGGMKNGNIDVYCDTHSECYDVTGTYDVWILWSPDWV